MENRWNADEAARFDGPLGKCVYGSRLIGADPDLVLHGGGNTSVKAEWIDITGESVDALYVKGSGWDLATIEAAGFTPLPLGRLRSLLSLDSLSDPDMMSSLSAARLDPSAPQPSVETLLHALLPHPAVQHSHADVIVTLTNIEQGRDLVIEAFGENVLIVPYVMPGFDLAKAVAGLWPAESTEQTIGMVLMNHGLFTFGDTTHEAYERHVELIDRAEALLERRAPSRSTLDAAPEPVARTTLSDLRRSVSHAAGRPMILSRHTDPTALRFVRRDDLASLAGRGPLTPDHVIRTKRLPLIGRDVDRFVDAYRAYFERNEHRGRTELAMLDPAPRVILDPELGMVTVGRTARDADIVADIYHHTMPVLERAEDHLGGYRALSEQDLFDTEYWDLEQAKLRRQGKPPELAGHVALVTGAASGIGNAGAAELLDRGAAVVGLDRDDSVIDAFPGPSWLGIPSDVTDGGAVDAALDRAVTRFGGIDLAVVAAGIFGESAPIADLDPDEWRRVQAVNADSVATLFRFLHPLLRRSPAAAAVTVVASKNAPAPGRGAAAYSASKAAVTQLARVAALEWAEDGIRVNVVHPDAVFDTGLWTEELITQRAERYGMTPEQYKRRNLLSVEVTSATVAGVIVDLLTRRFAATTGAQIAVDGGSDRTV